MNDSVNFAGTPLPEDVVQVDNDNELPIFQSNEALLQACDVAISEMEQYSQLLNNGTGKVEM